MMMKRMSARLGYAVAVLILAGCTSGGGITPSKFLFASNEGSNNTVSAFTINASTGALTPVGAPIAADNGPNFMAVTPNGSFLYVTNTNTNPGKVSAYSIDRTTGALTAVTGSPFITTNDSGPFGIAVDPSGKFLYTANNTAISAFTINATTGALTDVPGTPFPPGAAGALPEDLRVDPTGKFLFVSNTGPQVVSAFTIDATTGALTAVAGSPFPTAAATLLGLVVDPTGKFVYTVDDTNNNILAFSINATSGVLTPAGPPFATGGMGSQLMAVGRTGKFLYVSDVNSNDIAALAINATTGALTPITGSPFPTGANTAPTGLAIDASGKFGYAALTGNGINAVGAATIDRTTGALKDIAGSPFATGGMRPTNVAVASPK
jgi:6-phosphogluconolactonase